jgi:hypothetical protein
MSTTQQQAQAVSGMFGDLLELTKNQLFLA